MLRRLRSDQRGIAAVEFAIIAPIMVALYCALAELSMAMMAERRVAHTASVVADLVAQTGSVSGQDITDIFSVGNAILSPFPTATLSLRVTSVTADKNGSPLVVWSKANGSMSPLKTGIAVPAFPANLLQPADSVIKAEVQYAYTSPLGLTLPQALNFTESFYLKPRQSAAVILTTP